MRLVYHLSYMYMQQNICIHFVGQVEQNMFAAIINK